MTYFVYILYSKKDGNLYTGCTSNLKRRLSAHNGGSVASTKNRRPLELIWKEEYADKIKAFSRERYLKTKWGNTFKQRVKKFYVNKISHTD
jgi:putative endonuclease